MKQLLNKIGEHKEITIIVLAVIGIAIGIIINTFAFKVTDKAVVDGLEFQNASINKNNYTVYVTNTKETDYNLTTIEVKLFDKDNNIIATMSGYVGDTIKPNEVKTLSVTTDKDLTEATDVEYEIKK
jgi:hypothetical protein